MIDNSINTDVAYHKLFMQQIEEANNMKSMGNLPGAFLKYNHIYSLLDVAELEDKDIDSLEGLSREICAFAFIQKPGNKSVEASKEKSIGLIPLYERHLFYVLHKIGMIGYQKVNYELIKYSVECEAPIKEEVQKGDKD